MKSIKTKIPISQIVLDKSLYPRNDYFWQVAYDYSESMKAGAVFPRIVVAKLGNSMVLVDGKHRMEALIILSNAKVNGKHNKNKEVPMADVEVLVGLNRNQIYEEAIRRNITHGKSFSVQEKLNIAVKLRDLKYSTEQISKLVQIVPSKLTPLITRRLFNSITGQEVILKKEFENISDESRQEGFENNNASNLDVEVLQQSFAGKSHEKIIDELIILISSKAIDLKDGKMIQRLKKLKALINKIKVLD